MGKIHVKIDDNTERRLREMATKRFGNKKGSLSKAINEAINNWLASLESKDVSDVNWENFIVDINIKNKKLLEQILEESKTLNESKITRLLKVLGLEET